MTRHRSDVASALDTLVPPTRDHGDWEAVLRDARRRRVHGAWTARVAALAAAALGVTALALAWPFAGDEPGGVLDRALAAVGDGPVLHVVLEGTWGGDVVDLGTGERRRVPGTTEIWYDAERRLMRSVSRLGAVVQHDETYRPRGPNADIAALGERYRSVLEAGTARVFGEGEVDGTPVWWIVVRREDLPDVADRKTHAWTQEVAVSRRSYEPVALRETRDGVEGPGTRRVVRVLEYVHAEAAGFGDPERAAVASGPFYFAPGLGPPALTLADARDVLGRPPLWAGRQLNGLPLAHIGREAHGWFDPVTRKRDGTVGVVLVYGRTTHAGNREPRLDGPYAVVRQTTAPPSALPGNAYFPPPGAVYLSGTGVLLRADGLYVRIEAPSTDLALAAARALERVPAG